MKFQDPNPLLGGPTYQIIRVFLSSQCLYLTPITSWTISLTSNMAVVPHSIHWLHLAHAWPYSFRHDLTRKTPENCHWMSEAVPNSEVNVSVLSFETPVKGTRKELNYLARLFLYWTQNTESKRNGSSIQKEPLTNVRPTGSKPCYTPDTVWGMRKSIKNKNNFSCPWRVHGFEKTKRLKQLLSLRAVIPDSRN